ncbi:MAG TPA: lysine--tRNA ligase [Methanomassiliicoccales archaeon]|nr:lysine--tRNA ligase [Methanomassiliicoccales archaeon]
MHWADVIANTLMARGDKHLISTGITPSGYIHVGSLRESITANAVFKALKDRSADVDFIYLVDSYDPLRKRYPFLPESFEKEVGKPICYIPCPDNCHGNYAEHFITPFLEALGELGINPRIIWTHKLYEEGKFTEIVDLVLKERTTIASILGEVTGRKMPENFWPFTPECPKCGLFTDKVLGYEFPYVHYKCGCGHEGDADIRKGQGKMPWRVEWAAKWKLFGVTCEPFGKDHAASGGSYDSGVRLAREIFGIEPPHPIPYEFIQFKGKGQMHKSTGNVVTGSDALLITPAPVLAFGVLRYNPERHIDYDPGLGIIDIVDEYDKVESLYFNGGADDKEIDLLRAYEIAQPTGVRPKLPLQVPYRHLVSIAQIADSYEGVVKVLKRSMNIDDISEEDMGVLKQRIECVRHWLNAFAPEEVLYIISPERPDMEINDDERNYIVELLERLRTTEWIGDLIHNAIYETAKKRGLQPKVCFQVLYRLFISRRSGPKLGFFLSTMDKDFVLKRLSEA